jgi:predicted AlkP superfamily pyrophosphatase or phosphodiesterase
MTKRLLGGAVHGAQTGIAGRARRAMTLMASLVTGVLACTTEDVPRPVILVGIDAFGWDFLGRADTPNLDAIVDRGVRAEWMVPTFPTKTFPNHYSIATGLHPDRHGIVANNMLDPDIAERFSLGNRHAVENGRWWQGEPIWVTVEMAGLRAAAFFWPGTEADIQGVRPTFWRSYVHETPNDERVDQVLEWMDLPAAERPWLVTTYFADVDDATHRHGVDAPETEAAIREVDRAMGRLVDGLAARDMLDEVNVIVVSDHGMAPTSRARVIFLDDYVDMRDVEVIDWSPVAAIRPDSGLGDRVVRQLTGAHPHLTVYRKSEIPERWRYRNHPRIQPILAVADEGWEITTREYFAARPTAFTGATHGYDNALPSMRATFLAAGPSFRRGVVVAPFQNVHVYALLCRILGIEPAPNDGSLDSVAAMLR